MTPKTFIFIGKSGSGKGTQADLLMRTLKEKDPGAKVFHLESGERFRNFIAAGDSCASKFAAEINQAGGLQPEFLAIWIWTDILVKNLCGDEHLIVDGTPRKLHEVPVLETALEFYRREKPYVVVINVGDAWARLRMQGRHRDDDESKSIERRLSWFATEVHPIIEYYKKSSEKYTFVEVNGEQTIEAVHQDIMKSLNI